LFLVQKLENFLKDEQEKRKVKWKNLFVLFVLFHLLLKKKSNRRNECLFCIFFFQIYLFFSLICYCCRLRLLQFFLKCFDNKNKLSEMNLYVFPLSKHSHTCTHHSFNYFNLIFITFNRELKNKIDTTLLTT